MIPKSIYNGLLVELKTDYQTKLYLINLIKSKLLHSYSCRLF